MLRCSFLAATGLWLIFAPPVLAQKQLPSYDALRDELIRKGYRPLKLVHGDMSYFCLDGFCDAYPEAVSCTQAGLPYCSMGFSKPGRGYIIVDTYGEAIHKLGVVRRRRPGHYELCSIKEGHDDYQDCDPVPDIKRK